MISKAKVIIIIIFSAISALLLWPFAILFKQDQEKETDGNEQSDREAA